MATKAGQEKTSGHGVKIDTNLIPTSVYSSYSPHTHTTTIITTRLYNSIL